MNKVRWGVLGAAKIGMEKVTPALQRQSVVRASKPLPRAPWRARKAAAGKLGIPEASGSYEGAVGGALRWRPFTTHCRTTNAFL